MGASVKTQSDRDGASLQQMVLGRGTCTGKRMNETLPKVILKRNSEWTQDPLGKVFMTLGLATSSYI